MALDKAYFKSIACNANRSAIIREGNAYPEYVSIPMRKKKITIQSMTKRV